MDQMRGRIDEDRRRAGGEHGVHLAAGVGERDNAGTAPLLGYSQRSRLKKPGDHVEFPGAMAVRVAQDAIEYLPVDDIRGRNHQQHARRTVPARRGVRRPMVAAFHFANIIAILRVDR
ncbi:MAG TPA: hypothetical protein PLU30_13610 [Verrucomicrobiae bacterium]|nr:hypothetical protein [Verrucomicrobiae bacterium]